MKKPLLQPLLLVALSTPLLAHAEGQIYGVLSMSVNQVDSDQSAAASALAGSEQIASFGSQVQSGQSADNNGSVIGLRGEKGQFFYAVELGLGIDQSNGTTSGLGSTHDAFVGVESRYGTLAFGRQSTPYKQAGQRLDPFYDTAAANFVGGFAPGGASYGLSNLINGWTDNSMIYISPEYAGMNFNLGVHLQELNDQSHDYSAGVQYRVGELLMGLQYLQIGAGGETPGVVAGAETDVDTALQVTASYAVKRWNLGASYEQIDVRLGDTRGHLYLTGSVGLSSALTLAVSGGAVDAGEGEGFGATLGLFVTLIEQFQVYALGSYADCDSGSENTTASLGLRYEFNL